MMKSQFLYKKNIYILDYYKIYILKNELINFLPVHKMIPELFCLNKGASSIDI